MPQSFYKSAPASSDDSIITKKEPPRRVVVIKRYQNRKLYDTNNSSYVTLEDIGEIIRRGDDVKVVDNRTKEDLTTVTLTQIIFEEEKKNKNALPLSALKRIIRGGGDAILGLVTKTTDNVQNTLSTLREGAENIAEKLGDAFTPDGKLITDVFQKTQHLSKNIEDRFKTAVDNITHVATLQNEVRKLRQRVMYLEKKLKVYESK